MLPKFLVVSVVLSCLAVLSGCRDDAVAEVEGGAAPAVTADGGDAADDVVGAAAPAVVAGGKDAAKPATVAAAQPLVISGRVSMEDGSPPRGDIKDIAISISGVSEAAVNVQYSPAVQEDGTYRQKVSPGQYVFNTSRISVIANGNQFDLPLEPVGRFWNKDRDAADGIVQDFVWKVTGPTPYGQSEGLSPANHTHWYGMSVGLSPEIYREDIKASAAAIPDGTKLVFTFKPTTKSIDGRELESVTVERTFKNETLYDADINDLTPASYEMTGAATLPDGTVKPLLLQGHAEYPKYSETVQVKLSKDNIIGGMAKHAIDFTVD